MIRLFLEQLEDRLAPAGGGGLESVTISVTYQPNKTVVLSGNETQNGLPAVDHTIRLTGPVTANVTTNRAGDFSGTYTVANLGVEYATDADGLSNTAFVNIVGGNPVIQSFTCVSQGGGLWLCSGSVTDCTYQGEVINFTGQVIGSTQVKADGTFAFSVMNPGQGWETATAVDWWGDQSQPVTDAIG